ncbi:MAG: T9SS type A sorting domain-containing protein [Bacteroidota bacterium]
MKGQTWVQSQDTLLHGTGGFIDIHLLNDTFVAYNNGSIYRFKSFNQNWEYADVTQIPIHHRSYYRSFQREDTLFLFTSLGKCFRTTDAALTWQEVFLNGFSLIDSVPVFLKSGNLSFAVFPSTVYSSFDGINWIYFCSAQEFEYASRNYPVKYIGQSVFVYDSQLQLVNTFIRPAEYFSPISAPDQDHYQYFFNQYTDSFFRFDILDPQPMPEFLGTVQLDPFVRDSANFFSYTIHNNMHLLAFRYESPSFKGKMYYYLSSNNGQTWQPRQDLLWMLNATVFPFVGDTAFGYDYRKFEYRVTENAGQTWRSMPHGLSGLFYHNTCYSSSLDTVLLYKWPDQFPAELNEGLLRSTDGGQTWAIANNGLPDSINVYYDSTLINSGRIYGPVRSGNKYMLFNADDYNLYRSLDAGTSWQQSTMPPLGEPYFIGTDDNDIFIRSYIGFTNTYYYYRTTDAGNTWITLQLPSEDTVGGGRSANYYIQGKNDTLFCLSRQYYPSSFYHYSHRLHISNDDGMTWNDITPINLYNNTNKLFDLGAFLSEKPLFTFGNNANEIMAVIKYTDSTFFRTTYVAENEHDSLYLYNGTSWSVIQHNGLPTDIDIQSINYVNGTFYIGSNYGVYISYDYGQNWILSSMRTSSNQTSNIQSVLPGDMRLYQINATQQKITLATKNNGVWIMNNLTLGSAPPDSSLHNVLISLSVYPNPSHVGTFINWSVSETILGGQLLLLDASGKVVRTNSIQNVPAHQPQPFATKGLQPGVYHLVIKSGQKVFRGSVVIQ